MSKASQEKYRATSVTFAHYVDTTDLHMSELKASLYLLELKPGIKDNLSNLNHHDFFASYVLRGFGE